MKIVYSCLLGLMLTSFSVNGQKSIYIVHKGLVKFVSDAPLEVIKASSTQIRGALDSGKRNFSFLIPSTSFIGFNSPLQQVHFYENYIEAQKYPESRFIGKIIEQVDFNADGDYQVRAKGILTIHGVDQERIIRVKLHINKGDITASSEFSILLKEYNITIPRVVYQKIAEEIKINVNLEMAQQ